MTVYAVPAEAPPGLVPPGYMACPTHGHLVAWTPGLLLGLCPGCAMETANGLVELRRLANEAVGR